MMDVQEVRSRLVEEAREVDARPAIVEAVPAQRIALVEVVHPRAHADPAVVELDRGTGRELAIGGTRVDRDRPARPLLVGQPPGVHLGAGEVLRRPAVHEMDDGRAWRRGGRSAGGRSARAAQGFEDRPARRGDRILGHPCREAGAKVGVAPRQGALGLANPPVARPSEAALSFVEDEGGVVEAVLPAGGGGAQAEVDLFAVAQPESDAVEGADLREQRALDVETESDRGGNARVEPRRRLFDERREAVDVEAGRQAIDLERPRERGERAVVGERRHGPDARRAGGRRGEPVEPAARHHRVAVEQDDVAPRPPGLHLTRKEPAVDRRRIAGTDLLSQHVERRGAETLTGAGDEELHGLLLRSVDDEQQAMPAAIDVSFEAREAALERLGRAVDRHDDVDAAGPDAIFDTPATGPHRGGRHGGDSWAPPEKRPPHRSRTKSLQLPRELAADSGDAGQPVPEEWAPGGGLGGHHEAARGRLRRQGARLERREAAKIVTVPLRHRVTVLRTAPELPLDEGARLRNGVEEPLQCTETVRLALRPGPGERFDAGRAQESEQQEERGEAAAPADEERPHLIEQQRRREGECRVGGEDVPHQAGAGDGEEHEGHDDPEQERRVDPAVVRRGDFGVAARAQQTHGERQGGEEGEVAEIVDRGPDVDRGGLQMQRIEPGAGASPDIDPEKIEDIPNRAEGKEQPREIEEQARNRRSPGGDDRPGEALAQRRGPRLGFARDGELDQKEGAADDERADQPLRPAGETGEQSESAEANPGAPGAGLEEEGEGGGDGEQEPGLRVGGAQAVLEQQSGGGNKGERRDRHRPAVADPPAEPGRQGAEHQPRQADGETAAELVLAQQRHAGAVPPDDDRGLPDERRSAAQERRPLTGMQRPGSDPDVERLVAEEGDFAQLVEEEEGAGPQHQQGGGPKGEFGDLSGSHLDFRPKT